MFYLYTNFLRDPHFPQELSDFSLVFISINRTNPNSIYDNCVYFKLSNVTNPIHLLLYVDDILITCKSITEIDHLNLKLNNEFDTKDLSPARKVLRIDIIKTNGKLFLSQQSYLEMVFKRFYMYDARLVTVPLGSHFKLSIKDSPETDCDGDYMNRVSYSNVVGSLMYAMACNSPDIT